MTSSFAFIPRAVKKKNHPPVSSHAPSASISVGAQVTSESTLPPRVRNNPKRTKGFTGSLESDKKKTKIEDDDDPRSAVGTETEPFQPTSVPAWKDVVDLEDLAQLVCLALSDYTVWADVDLRRKIDWGLENNQEFFDDDTGLVDDTSINENKGYIPLAYLLRHSQVFRLVSSSSSSIISQPQTTLIKAIRMHASHLIDVRLIIPSSSSTFPGNNITRWTKPHIQTGYELRRKEISSTLSNHGKKEWDALTIYMENIPNQYRSIPGIIRFVNGLLTPSPSSSPVSRIQNIFLPSHHQDQPNSIPTCKGFALVTLSHDEDVNALLEAWSWDPTDAMNSDRSLETGGKSAVVYTKGKGKDKECSDEEISPFHVEATKFGLRVLTKAKWEELRAEYLLYRQELVDEINTFQDEGQVSGGRSGGGRKRKHVDETHDQEEQITEEGSHQTNQIPVPTSAYIQLQPSKNVAIVANGSVGTAGIQPNSAYPPGCLVFVRNVHEDTNKTTLRNLFLHAQALDIEGGEKDGDGLDYLDYTKGMDCCHVRLRTSLHARRLVHHLSSNPIVQTSGLDTSGASFANLSSSDQDDTHLKPIMAEQVLGKREEVYWEKVPEKIGRQAAEKALSLLRSGSSCDVDSAPIADPSEGDTKMRKREFDEQQSYLVDLNIHANSAYPPGCLVFIRNAHPETNKTTLRSLFSHAREERVESGDPGRKTDEDGIDYLDYKKGMDCCYVRLRTPIHAEQLVHHLSSNLIAQTTGLDASGSRLARPGTSSSDKHVKDKFAHTSQLKILMAEQVLGKREEVYWEKVPEKVRRQAVDKALSFLHGRDDSGGVSSVDVSEGSNKPKKRRKN